MVISVVTKQYKVERVLIDQGSSANILYWTTAQKLGVRSLTRCEGVLYGFVGERVPIRGTVEIETTFGDRNGTRTIPVVYTVVDIEASYNIIMGRPALNKLEAVVSTHHLCMKFPTGRAIATVWVDITMARRCYEDSLRIELTAKEAEVNVLDIDLDPRYFSEEKRPHPVGDLKEVQIGLSADQKTNIGTMLGEKEESQLISTLRRNADIFAWTTRDMPGIDPRFMCHHLSVSPRSKPVAQRKRKQGEEKRAAIKEEVRKLLAAGFVKEVQYPTWLANVVMVKKANGRWRMCTDYTDLNKACPKDPYPLPSIDRLVDGVSGHALLSFMDAYSGYNQIWMHLADEEKTAFITEEGAFCYKVMPFGLKNAGATYQRLMDKVFQEIIGEDMEVYVDDMVVKSSKEEAHYHKLERVFTVLRKNQLRLNLQKCSFGVRAGKFLGFMLTERGIEANLDKCQAIIDMRSPQNVKEVQQLMGKVAALSRFIPRSAETALPIFEALKKGRFTWTNECEEAFKHLKMTLSAPPILTRPVPGIPLHLYLSASEKAISSVLIQERDGEQWPVYFVSKVLQELETRYPRIDKVALALVTTSRRLRPYFQNFSIVVRTDLPIRQVLGKPDLARRMVAWSVQLSEFDITFESRGHVKAQAMTDFLVEMTPATDEDEKGEWFLLVDGSSNHTGSGVGVILEGPTGAFIEQSLHFEFKASNNQAEYEALLAGMKLAQELGVKKLTVKSDSKLVTGQVNGEYQAKDPQLAKYRDQAAFTASSFDKFTLLHVPRDQNERADLLAKLASTQRRGQQKTMIPEKLSMPAIERPEILSIGNKAATWMTPILDYLKKGAVPEDPKEALKTTKEATKYTILGQQLYRRGFSFPLLKCLEEEESSYVIKEVHEGVCGTHIGGRALASKIARAGYLWPTMKRDCMDYVKKCDKCQRFAERHKAPLENLHHVTSPWPFFKWGVDILGPFPPAPGQIKFLIVVVDYFTKWVEAEPVATITTERIKRFYWKKIICRFGILAEIVSDNGIQFASKGMVEFCKELNIKQVFTSVKHPQSNGQAEAANKVILRGLRRRLEEAKGRWAEELPQVLWSYHTTPNSTTNETPFRLTFGTEAMIPVEIGEPSPRTALFEPSKNEEELRANLDLVQEAKEIAHVKEYAIKARAARKYNQRVIPREFKTGDLVLKKITMTASRNKLTPLWEGPFRVIDEVGRGAYKLESLERKALPRTWNAASLRMYYS
ncbi:Retrovirus-related Pol polyprotein, partial [Mucuna pruriens]